MSSLQRDLEKADRVLRKDLPPRRALSNLEKQRVRVRSAYQRMLDGMSSAEDRQLVANIGGGFGLRPKLPRERWPQ
jgi:hypothetical protein